MDDESPRLVYNPDDGSLELRLGGRTITVDGVDAEIVFERMTSDGDAAAPLWLAQAEADVLRKMIRYILDRVRITEESKATLAGVLPRVEALADADPAAGTGDGNGDGDSTGREAPPARERDETGGTINVPGVRRGLGRGDDVS